MKKRPLTPLFFACAISALSFLVLVSSHSSVGTQPICNAGQSYVYLSYHVLPPNGTGQFNPPILSDFQNGNNITGIRLTENPFPYCMDSGSPWAVSRTLPNSTTFERGESPFGNHTGNADNQRAKIIYYWQYYATFGVPDASNLTSYSLPTINYTSMGAAESLTAGGSVWADYDSSYSYSNVVGTPTNIRYYIRDPTGVVKNQAQVVPPYIEQYLTKFNLDNHGSEALSSVGFTAKFGGNTTSLALLYPSEAFWIDAGSPIAFPQTINSTSGSNRWVLNSVNETVAGAPKTVPVVYFEQYPLTVLFTISSGTAPSGTILTYAANGQPLSVELYSGAPPTWVDGGSGYSLSALLQGSNSFERWKATSGTSGVMNSATTVTLFYFHQVWVTLSYSVSGGGSVGPVNASFVSLGSKNSTVVEGSAAGEWMDEGSVLSVPSVFSGQSPQERWALGSSSSYMLLASQALSLVYYHQYLVPTSFNIAGGGNSPGPELTGVEFGASSTSPIKQGNSVWLDSGSPYSVPQALQWGNVGERWYATSPANGSVNSETSISPSYLHQFYVFLNANPPAAGTLTGSGWVSAGGSVSISVSTGGGWKFIAWTGNGQGFYSGSDQNLSVQAFGPIQETANFYVGFAIQVVGRGNVQVSYGGSSYTVQGTTFFFVPPGTNVTLAARPGAFEVFSGWQGIPAGGASAVVFMATVPQGINAVFSPNSIEILGIAVVIFGAAAYSIAYLLWRQRSSSGKLTPKIR